MKMTLDVGGYFHSMNDLCKFWFRRLPSALQKCPIDREPLLRDKVIIVRNVLFIGTQNHHKISIWQLNFEGRIFQSTSEWQESHKPISTFWRSTGFCFAACPACRPAQWRVIHWSGDSFHCFNLTVLYSMIKIVDLLNNNRDWLICLYLGK